MKEIKYTIIPGRGLNTHSAVELRKEYLQGQSFEIDKIEATNINHADVQNNIESWIGSVEIPTALVGPLIFKDKKVYEEVFCIAGTLEGALVASMNRGAKAISLSGGFLAKVHHQKMVRTPLFLFANHTGANEFANWIKENFKTIKEVAERYSNHAILQEIDTDVDSNNVHAHFIYSTGDAAGQNMTTTCTWHAILWAVEKFEDVCAAKILDYVLEGNGSSDKKVSRRLMDTGRGIKVEATCILNEEVIRKVLRTSSEKLLRFYVPSRSYALKHGMLGYNINVANAIAAIFVATGQDLASIHESALADLELAKVDEGLQVKLILHSLVIGTLGGGTQLPKQKQALGIMRCDGKDKVIRLASLIAGFALGLEISTYSAMVSGEFAKAHEKLGRNKPVNWLQRHELTTAFLEPKIRRFINADIIDIKLLKDEVENGIIMNLSKKVNRKLIGFIPIEVETTGNKFLQILIKSKPGDMDQIKGVHLMAASIDPGLSDLIYKHKDNLEYAGSDLKELLIPQILHENKLNFGPRYYGNLIDTKREIFLLFQEHLHKSDMLLMDSENKPELWTEDRIFNCIQAISKIQNHYLEEPSKYDSIKLQKFKSGSLIPLYQKILEILKEENNAFDYLQLNKFLGRFDKSPSLYGIQKTLVHNDFNPRNIAIRKNGEECIYDWELAVLHYPHRDVVELLSFTLPNDFSEDDLLLYLHFHYEQSKGCHGNPAWEIWKKGYILTLKEYLISRVCFYKTAEILMKLKFVDRIYKNSMRMLKILEG